MIGKKINQLATELAPVSTDLTIIGDPISGVSKKITLAQLGAIFSGAVSFYNDLASFPATGDINVIYCAKDTQKLYLWSGSAYTEVFPSQALLDTYQLRSEKGVSNGYASLDSSGKVPISQLPSSIMEYKGTWNAATNTPTLANGTGDTGDVYICNVAGTVDFGAGPITFAVGDYTIYSGSIWQRSSGAVGTVTSVAASITGDAIGITGSPVTTSGTLAFAFAGTGTQYIKGDGTLATFPNTIAQATNLITEVYNSTGATLTKGTVVYINGGQGNLPTVTKALATGDSTSAQTFGVVQADITNNNNGYVVVAGKLSDLDTQAYTEGTQLYLSSTTAGTWTSTKQYAPAHLVYVGIVVRSHPTQGIVEIKIQNGYELDEIHNVAAQTPTNNDGLFWESATSLWKNKSISTILGGTPVIGSGTTNFVSKFTASSTIGSSQIWDNGTSVLIGTTGTLPGVKVGIYSSTQRALEIVSTNSNALFVQSPAAYILTITNGTWTSQFTNTGRLDLAGDLLLNTIANATIDTDKFLVSDSGVIKYRTGAELLSDIGGASASGYVPYTGATTNLNLGSNNLTAAAITGSSARITTLAGSVYADVNGNLGTTAGTQNTIAYWGSQYSLASLSTTTYPDLTELSYVKGVTSSIQTQLNSKQSTLTNPVTGTGTTNYLPKFTGTSTIGNSIVQDDGSTLTIGGALSGRNATFTSSTANIGIIGTGTFSYLQLAHNGGATKYSYLVATNDGMLDIESNIVKFTDYSGASERMRINASGNVSIGNTNDTYKLDVSGTGRFTSSVTATQGIFRNSGVPAIQVIRDLNVVSVGTAGQGIEFGALNGSTPTAGAAIYGTLDNPATTGALVFQTLTAGSLTTKLTLASTGAATFSSSVTAGGSITSSGSMGRFGGWYDGNGFTGAAVEAGVSGGIGYVIGYNRSGSAAIPIVFGNAGNTSSMVGSSLSFTGAATFSSSVTATDLNVNRGGGAWQIIPSSGESALYFKETSTDNIRMTLRGSNVGIGTTSPLNLLDIGTPITNALYGFSLSYSGTAVGVYQVNNATGELKFGGAAAGYFPTFYAGGSEKMRITSGGNVGINTTSPAALFHVAKGSSGEVARFSAPNAYIPYIIIGRPDVATEGMKLSYDSTTGDTSFETIASHNMLFKNNNTERMRITSGGKLVIGATSTTYGSLLGVETSNSANPVAHFKNNRNTSGDTAFYLELGANARNTSSYYLQCFDSGQDQLYIYGNGNVVNRNNSYGAISDIRLKENISDTTSKLADLLKVKVRNYNLIGDDKKQLGVIAQELETIFPSMIEIDGKTGMKQVKYSVFVPMLIKAIQELNDKIK